MGLSLVGLPTCPLSLDSAKKQLHMEHDTSQDTLIESLRQAAWRHVENATRRALPLQTWRWTRAAFPACRGLEVPRAPLVSVSSITYRDPNGTLQTWAAEHYQVSIESGPFAGPGVITPAYGVSWPVTRGQRDDVTITFTAGYSEADGVPDALLQAMRMLVTHWFDTRTPVVTGTTATVVPIGYDALVWPYKVFWPYEVSDAGR